MVSFDTLLGTVAVVTALLLLMFYVATVYATVRHARYAASQRSARLPVFVPSRVALPDRAEQEAAYHDAQEWLDEARTLNVQTWLSGDSLQASGTIGQLYPWSATVTFAYYDPHRRKLASKWPLTVALRSRAYPPEQPMKTTSFGLLPAVQVCEAEVPAKPVPGTVIGPFTVRRRDVLDELRIPHAVADEFMSFVQ